MVFVAFCSLRILYNRKFILMTIAPETIAAVVTRVHCKCTNAVLSKQLSVIIIDTCICKYDESEQEKVPTSVVSSSLYQFQLL